MNIQIGEKKNSPNTSHHPKATFFWLPASWCSEFSKLEECLEVSNSNAKSPLNKFWFMTSVLNPTILVPVQLDFVTLLAQLHILSPGQESGT